MRSLKITLLLAVFCVGLMGVTYSNDSKNEQATEIERINIDSKDFDVVIDNKGGVEKPDQNI